MAILIFKVCDAPTNFDDLCNHYNLDMLRKRAGGSLIQRQLAVTIVLSKPKLCCHCKDDAIGVYSAESAAGSTYGHCTLTQILVLVRKNVTFNGVVLGDVDVLIKEAMMSHGWPQQLLEHQLSAWAHVAREIADKRACRHMAINNCDARPGTSGIGIDILCIMNSGHRNSKASASRLNPHKKDHERLKEFLRGFEPRTDKQYSFYINHNYPFNSSRRLYNDHFESVEAFSMFAFSQHTTNETYSTFDAAHLHHWDRII
ncbi:hypothetical protein EDD18DRAFT_1107663 [Armillaria luteobubalina]|uniref:Uncharacterized protein n=1 Tax=Armillaria luteobubalina TaxID=153913 RepID=A0AA39UMF1_9AGAR|nr:hypothetical protein EDD18DRAFT_1107663 [Armillaria luteobubalina]